MKKKKKKKKTASNYLYLGKKIISYFILLMSSESFYLKSEICLNLLQVYDTLVISIKYVFHINKNISLPKAIAEICSAIGWFGQAIL
jgi:hypothetical protein